MTSDCGYLTDNNLDHHHHDSLPKHLHYKHTNHSDLQSKMAPQLHKNVPPGIVKMIWYFSRKWRMTVNFNLIYLNEYWHLGDDTVAIIFKFNLNLTFMMILGIIILYWTLYITRNICINYNPMNSHIFKTQVNIMTSQLFT